MCATEGALGHTRLAAAITRRVCAKACGKLRSGVGSRRAPAGQCGVPIVHNQKPVGGLGGTSTKAGALPLPDGRSDAPQAAGRGGKRAHTEQKPRSQPVTGQSAAGQPGRGRTGRRRHGYPTLARSVTCRRNGKLTRRNSAPERGTGGGADLRGPGRRPEERPPLKSRTPSTARAAAKPHKGGGKQTITPSGTREITRVIPRATHLGRLILRSEHRGTCEFR